MCNAPDLEGLPEPERPILERALAKRPEDRWPDCRSFVDALKVLGPAGEGSIPDALPRDRRGLSSERDGEAEFSTPGLDLADTDFIPVDSGEFESPYNGIKAPGDVPTFWRGPYGFGPVSRAGTWMLDHLSRYGHDLRNRLAAGWPTHVGAGHRAAGSDAVRRDWSARLEPIRALAAMRLDRLRQIGGRAADRAAARPGWRRLGSIAVLVVSVLVLWNLVSTFAARHSPAESSAEVAVAQPPSSHRPDATASGSHETGITPGPTLEPSSIAAAPEAPVIPPAPAVPERTPRAPVDSPRPKETAPTGRLVAAEPRDTTPTAQVVAAKESTPTTGVVAAKLKVPPPPSPAAAATRPRAPAGTNPIGSGRKSTLAWLQKSDLIRLVSPTALPAPRRAEANKGSVGGAPPGSSAGNAGRRPSDRPVSPRVVTPIIALPAEVKFIPGTSAKVHVRVQRRDVAEPVQLDLRGLPRGITAAGLTIPAGKDSAEVVLASSAEPPPGIAEVKVAFQAGSERGEASTRINILPPPPATVAFKRGLAAFGVGSFDRAIADFTEAIRLDPNAFGARFYRGIIHALAGRSQEALADYTAAIQLQPDRPEAYLERARVYIGLGAETLALNDCNEAIRLRPDAEAYLVRAGLHHEMGSYDQAVADCDRALRLRPGDPAAFFLRGLTRYHSGDYAGAVADLTEVIRRDPKDARAYRVRGDAHARLGKRASAEADHGVFERLNRPAA
jgi:Tfp pilus assembly protein PilF